MVCLKLEGSYRRVLGLVSGTISKGVNTIRGLAGLWMRRAWSCHLQRQPWFWVLVKKFEKKCESLREHWEGRISDVLMLKVEVWQLGWRLLIQLLAIGVRPAGLREPKSLRE